MASAVPHDPAPITVVGMSMSEFMAYGPFPVPAAAHQFAQPTDARNGRLSAAVVHGTALNNIAVGEHDDFIGSNNRAKTMDNHQHCSILRDHGQ